MLNEEEIGWLIKLLDDPDQEVSAHVEDKILSYGIDAVDYLESIWESSFDPIIQNKIEELIHKIQFKHVKQELELWYLGGSFDLLQGVLIVNRYQYPDLDTQKVINYLEEIKREVWLQMIYDSSPVEKVKLINHVLYSIYGFSGNTNNHQDPQNSYISQVLERKKGNQILLAVIYAVIAQKLDIPIYGVNLPQHFILGYVDESADNAAESVLFYINAFNRGFIFGKRDIDSFLRQLNLKQDATFYEPCSNADIVRRILRNLIAAYTKLGYDDKVKELEMLLAVLEQEK